MGIWKTNISENMTISHIAQYVVLKILMKATIVECAAP